MIADYKYGVVELSEIEDFRMRKLEDYKEQVSDYLEEGIVTYEAKCVAVFNDNEKIGYFCVGTNGELKNKILEFYLKDLHKKNATSILTQAVKTYGWKGWIVNSQDSFALPLMMELGCSYQICGQIFGHKGDENGEKCKRDNTLIVADIADASEVYDLIMQDDFYTGGDLASLKNRILDKEVYLLKRGGKLIGVGFLSVLKRTPQYADLAMIIAPDERRKGYGECIQKAMIEECYVRKIVPTASCNVNNLLSRKTLEKAGFHVDGCLFSVEI